MKKFLALILFLPLITSPAMARTVIADNLSDNPDAIVEVRPQSETIAHPVPEMPQDHVQEEMQGPTQQDIAPAPQLDADPQDQPEADIQEGPEAYGPAYEPPMAKEEIYRVETNPCDSKDVKGFLEGDYIIVGQKKASGGVPAKSDLYTASANVKLEGCDLKITLCTEGGKETGQMKGILALADKIPMWKIESSTKTGELKEYFLQMTSDLDNYPVLYGWGHQGYEFWRPAHNEKATCQ